MSEWPKLDPVTNREICQNCWNGIHYHKLTAVRKDPATGIKHYIYKPRPSLTGAEHDCIHLSEESWAKEEKAHLVVARRERRKTLKSQLEDPNNPLRAENTEYRVGRPA